MSTKKCAKKVRCLLIIRLLVFFTFPASLFAQKSQPGLPSGHDSLFTISDSFYGANDELINGCIYTRPEYRIQGHPYFNSQEWQPGIFFIKGKVFPGLQVKYDLRSDEAILNILAENGNEILLNVNKNQVDSFLIGNSLFINSGCFLADTSSSAFYEEIVGGEYLICKKFEKRFIDMYTSSSPYGKFSVEKTTLFLLKNKALVNINQKKFFLALFEKGSRAKIKRFMKENKINYRSASPEQMGKLMDYCSQLIFV